MEFVKLVKMAEIVCSPLINQEKIKSDAIPKLSEDFPITDLFKMTSFTPENYEAFSNFSLFTLISIVDNKYTAYSSDYMKLIGKQYKNSDLYIF